MTYDELEQRLGYRLGESDTTSTNWTRYPQSIRRDAIRESENRLALDLNPRSIPELIVTKTLAYSASDPETVQSTFQCDLSYLDIPMLKLIRIIDQTINTNKKLLIPKDTEQFNYHTRFTWRNREPYFYRLEGQTYQLVYPDGSAYNAIVPILYYIKKPQTAEQFTAGYLLGGNFPTTTISTWQAVTQGTFQISIDGNAHGFAVAGVDSINFSTAYSMTDVASLLQTAVRAASGEGAGFSGATVIWDDENTRFKIVSGGTSGITSVSVMTAGADGTDISGAGATAYCDCDAGANGESSVAGQPAFEYGDITTQLQDHENALLLYGSYYCKRLNNENAEAEAFLKDYLMTVQLTNSAYADQV